ncbi:MAG: formylglycine-generating enzyme family protein [Methanosarcinaceae archaeon]|nr:formylglycine-generating enzyme family protein [Methanosarcinaceae archaeon]
MILISLFLSAFALWFGVPELTEFVNPPVDASPGIAARVDHTNSIGMDFVEITAGEFMMGAGSSWSRPVHSVTIGRPFYPGKYEVTQEQWFKVMGFNPSYFDGGSNPVEQVSWNDVREFVKRLNEMEDTDKYRLPSVSEWEYACRAGTTTFYFFGDSESCLDDYAWYDTDPYNADQPEDRTHPAGQKKANPRGLYDMHGNVHEWCQDIWHGSYLGTPDNGSAFETIDPGVGASAGAKLQMDLNIKRVLRGGSWDSTPWYLGCACRRSGHPENGYYNSGFRLVREK